MDGCSVPPQTQTWYLNSALSSIGFFVFTPPRFVQRTDGCSERTIELQAKVDQSQQYRNNEAEARVCEALFSSSV
jgi:hypothetical protein